MFHPDRLPRYHGPEPEKVQRLDLDCCPDAACPQREFNRATALTLEKLSQSYASLWLLYLAVPKVWPCNADGHTEGCSDPSCTYGRDMADRVLGSLDRLEATVVRLFGTLSSASMDLAGEWTAFTVSEISGHVLNGDDPAPRFVEEDALAHLREEAVGSDPRELRRWFEPPARRESGYPQGGGAPGRDAS